MKKVFVLLLQINFYLLYCAEAQTVFIPDSAAGIGPSTNANVGIGTASPEEKLHILGHLKLQGNSNLTFNAVSANPYGAINFKHQGESRWLIDYGTGQTNNLRFLRFSGGLHKTFLNFDYDNSEFEILNTKVGIGTSSPVLQLHLKDPNGGAALGLQRNGKLWRFDLDFTEARKLYIGHTDKPNVLVLSRDGNVGIGDTTPDAKLTVAGKIHSREVKVTVNAGGADFVFEESYPLLELDELQAFIKENKHLPEIAPEKEMLEKGLEVGKFQIKLLQKIEELTLYIIDQEKRMRKLEALIEQLVEEKRQ